MSVSIALTILLSCGVSVQEASALGSLPSDRSAAFELELPAPTPSALPAWRRHILPAGDELAFEAIPWETSFAAGVRRADREGKPLLFWAMNGHPLGCT